MRLKMDLPTAGEVQWFVVSFELVPDFGFVPVNPASPLAQRYILQVLTIEQYRKNHRFHS